MIHQYWLRTQGIDGDYERSRRPAGRICRFRRLDRPRRPGRRQCHRAAQGGGVRGVRPACRGRQGSGAVNTLWREDGALCGDNTDVAGFLANLDAGAPDWRRATGTAVVGARRRRARDRSCSALARPRAVAIVNRTLRAPGFRRPVWRQGHRRVLARLPQCLERADLLVNATTLGMAGQGALTIDLEPMKTTAVVTDIVYIPLATPLIEAARRRGLAPSKGSACCCTKRRRASSGGSGCARR